MSILTGWNDPYALAEDQARAMNSMRASERDRIAFGEEEKNAAAKEAQRGIQQEYGVGELGALPKHDTGHRHGHRVSLRGLGEIGGFAIVAAHAIDNQAAESGDDAKHPPPRAA